MTERTLQRNKVLDQLSHGRTVTKLTAVHQRIGNINEVIRQLRLRGWEIHTLSAADMNGDRYTKYSLVERQRPAARDYVGMVA